MSSAHNLVKQFGPRSGPTNRGALSGSKLFDILMVFLKEFFQKINFEKNRQTTKKHEGNVLRQLLNDPFLFLVKKTVHKQKVFLSTSLALIIESSMVQW